MKSDNIKIYPTLSGNFEKKLVDLYCSINPEDLDFDEVSLDEGEISLRDIIVELLETEGIVDKFIEDLNILDVSTENLEVSRVKKTDTGVEYAILFVGGDWQHPVNYIIYFNYEDKLRCYLPCSGNLFNQDNMSAIGENYEGVDVRYLLKNYPYLLSEGPSKEEYEENIKSANDISIDMVQGYKTEDWFKLIDDISIGHIKPIEEVIDLIPSKLLDEDVSFNCQKSGMPNDKLCIEEFEEKCRESI